MKQIIALFTLSFILFACGGKKEQPKVDEIKEEVTEQIEETAENTEEVVEEAVEDVKEEVKNIAKKTEELASGAKRIAQGKGQWTGSLISLTDFVTSSSKDLSQEEAVALVKDNKMIGFNYNGSIFMVFNTDGTYANKSLTRSLQDGKVTVKGKINSVGGMNVIIADEIQ